VVTDSAQAHLAAAASLLARVGELPTVAQADLYDDVHRCLQEALADTDAR
jgi:hypothetical protein